MTDEPTLPSSRLRREPPAFRRVATSDAASIGPRLRRVTLRGAALEGFPVPLPAASVRLLLPPPGADELVVPTWNGNEFLLPDGRRPILRTFTPRRTDPEAGELDVDVVLHGGGVASEWAATAAPGAPVAVSGPGRGYTVDPAVRGYVLIGDETAIPAIAQLLEAIPATATVRVHVEVAAPEGRVALPDHPGATVTWHDLHDPTDPGAAMVAAAREISLDDDDRIWVAGEAASVQRIRRHLFEDRRIPRARATVRGYWKRGRPGGGDDA
jgi:NADPH-dependent ferric siderophore reductase